MDASSGVGDSACDGDHGVVILSPEDKLVRVLEKLADYEAMGVRGIFVVNPKSGEKYQYPGGDLKHVEQAALMVGQTGRMFRMSEIEGLVG